jgi:C-terminal processing protease CtpA/Prc
MTDDTKQTTTSFYPSLETLILGEIVSGNNSDDVKNTYLQDINRSKPRPKSIYNSTESNKSTKSNKSITGTNLYGKLTEMLNEITDGDYDDIRNHENQIAKISPENTIAIFETPVVNNMTHRDGCRVVHLIREQSDSSLGIGFANIDNGYYISFIGRNSSASRGQIRFGDQIIRINSLEMAGIPGKQVQKYIKCLPIDQPVSVIIRDRPLQRVFHLCKNELNQVGIVVKHGYISQLIANTSATRNGVPINHQIVEINSQNVIGLSNNDIIKIIQQSDMHVSISVIPLSIYKTLVARVGHSKLKHSMDHSFMTF